MAISLVIVLMAYACYSYEHRSDTATDTSGQVATDSSNYTYADKRDARGEGAPLSQPWTDNSANTRKPSNRYNAGKLMRVNGGTSMASQILNYPGFTISFNPEYHQPNYVVWELTRDEALSNKVRRTNNFQPDINVDGSADPEDYRNSGYDRGHMAPAGDMKWNQDAMNSCFLMTNMSPQTKALNTGAWNKLEEKCRDWAIRDSALIIVCGPILTDRLRKQIGRTRIPVPERYFKVILAPYADPPRGIGFIMPNGNVRGGLQGVARSIDEVEKITGYDFFPALPDAVEDVVEKECNYAKWTQKQRL